MQEFEMTQAEMDDIIAINKNRMPVMLIGGVTTGMDLQERVNAYWLGLSDKYGFKQMTVQPSSKGSLFFLAEPKPIVVPKTALDIKIDEYIGESLGYMNQHVRISIGKIADQLESAFTGDSKKISGDIGLNVAFMALKKMGKPGQN